VRYLLVIILLMPVVGCDSPPTSPRLSKDERLRLACEEDYPYASAYDCVPLFLKDIRDSLRALSQVAWKCDDREKAGPTQSTKPSE